MDFRSGRKRRPVTDVNITPLIDIVFNLLIFFLITTTFVQNPGIQVQLPKASDAQVTDNSNTVIIGVTANGRIINNGKALSPDELQTRLAARHKKSPNATIIVQADTNAKHGKVVQVMNIARVAGFTQLAIATQATGSQ